MSKSFQKDNAGLNPWFCPLPIEKVHGRFFRKCIDLILKSGVFEAVERGNKVTEFLPPEELKKQFDLKLRNEPESEEKLLEHMRKTLKYSVKTGHPYFNNQLYSGVDPFGLMAQWLTDALNPNLFTYEVAPVFTVMEEEVLAEMRRVAGFGEVGDGLFCPGGSLSNGLAMNCARYQAFPDVKKKGLIAVGPIVMFISKGAHYSSTKFAEFQGIGTDNVVGVETDARGKMSPDKLEEAIMRTQGEAKKPFLVVATAGTTVLGAYDPIDKIADICAKYKLWLHVDGAWGGSALLSKKHRNLLKGVERADSLTWNPHKFMCVPLQCSVMLTKHPQVLSSCHSYQADYLFQKDKCYDIKYDVGDKTIQCGRRADVFKLWFMWKAKGNRGWELHVDKVLSLAQYFKEELEKKEDFILVMPEFEFSNICFWYIPPSLRGKEKQPEYRKKLDEVAPAIKGRMMSEGSCMITYTRLDEMPNFFRFVLQNPALEKEDMDYVIKTIQRLGANL